MPEGPVQPGGQKVTSNPWAFALGAGTELVVSVLLGFLAGQWLDRRFATEPWLMLAGAGVGISVGLYQLIRRASPGRRGPPGRG